MKVLEWMWKCSHIKICVMELTKFVFRGNLIAPTSYIKKIEKSKISLPASLH